MACAQAFIDIANSLMTAAVFATAISFGALVTLPSNTINGPFISTLLAVAASVFTIYMFVAMGIPYILRKESNRNQKLQFHKSVLCQIHIWAVVALLMVGFVVLNVLLINFEQKGVGYAGIAMLGLIPVWYIAISFLEVTGFLNDGSLTSDQGPESDSGDRTSKLGDTS